MTNLYPRLHAALPFLLLLAIGIGARLMSLPANFSPTAALVLFAGFYFRTPITAVAIAIATLALSDLVLGGYEPGLMASVYAAMAVPVLLGRWLRHGLSTGRLGIAAVAVSLAFFVISNFGVWAFTGWYGPGLDGLVACYVAALPFLHHSLIGNLFWTALIFGAWYLAATRPVTSSP